MPRRNKRQPQKATKFSTNAETYIARAEADRERQEQLAALMRERYGEAPKQERDEQDD